MLIRDLTNVLPPAPALPVPSPGTAPPVPGGPPLPWRVEPRVWSGVMGTPDRVLPTKVFPDGRTGELLSPTSDEGQMWRYIEFLEAEVRHLRVEAETAVLIGPGPVAPTRPPENSPNLTIAAATGTLSSPIPDGVAGTVGEPVGGLPSATVGAVGEPPVGAPNPPSNPSISKRQLAETELLLSPGDSNVAISKRLGVSDELVRLTRKELEAAGRLPTAG